MTNRELAEELSILAKVAGIETPLHISDVTEIHDKRCFEVCDASTGNEADLIIKLLNNLPTIIEALEK